MMVSTKTKNSKKIKAQSFTVFIIDSKDAFFMSLSIFVTFYLCFYPVLIPCKKL
jgi:hypothetical protein